MKPALLIIDVQKQFYHTSPQVAQSLQNAVNTINKAIALFRKKGLPIVAIRQMVAEEGLLPGAVGFENPDDLAVLPTDIHIHKTYFNSFNKTDLLSQLQALGVDTVITTGYCAEQCVLSTYRGAKDVDLTPIMLRGALASGNAEHIQFVENISEVMSFGVLEKIVE